MSPRELVLDCAFPAEPGESRKSMLQRAARNAGLSYARMVAFFYGKGNPPDEARRKLEAEAARIKREWLDIALDKRLAEMAATRERLIEQREAIDRKISGIDGALSHGPWTEDRRIRSEIETGDIDGLA